MTPIVRRLLLFILLLEMAGTLVELVLLEHDEDFNQWIPLVLLTVGIVTFGLAAVRPTAQVIRALQIIMAFFISPAWSAWCCISRPIWNSRPSSIHRRRAWRCG